jgi:cell fate regulator YaaT (PSP1 superfamily)
MSDVIGIRYQTADSIEYCGAGDLNAGVGDYVIVTKDDGEHLGWVVLAADQVIASTIERPVRLIDRLASADDVSAWERQKERGEEDVGRAQALATRNDSRMRVASVSYDLSGERGELTYTAPERHSTDRLQREAEELLGSRLVVRQVGDRDRAKSLGDGAMGLCGRDLCCTSWMTEFPSVSIRMAKDQGLAPNPAKISGLCGRLLCCLSFEVEAYRELRGDLPKVGKRVTTPIGRAKVISIDALKQVVRLRLEEDGEIVELEADQLRAQYGSLVRPAELEAAVEEPARAEARDLQAATIAVMEPVDHPPERQPAATKSGTSDDEQQKPRRKRRGRRGGKRRRGRGGEGGAANDGSGPSSPGDN